MPLSCVTNDIYLGRFASRERLAELRGFGITDILNVSDTPNQLTIDDGPFRSIAWVNIEDRVRIPTDDALRATDTLHRMISAEGGRVYVHCMAGWNRSPTILWLYLIACNLSPALASQQICANAFDAVPGHPSLVDSDLVQSLRKHGRANYEPHPRPSALVLPDEEQPSDAPESLS